jgi:hypothetical protein
MDKNVRIEEADGKPKKRELLWGGLAARCSTCSWKRVYDPNACKHHLPNDELANIIRSEFEHHKCQDRQSAD